jgi:hypothetical protein
VHFRHESTVGGPLRGAAFPQILPEIIPSERLARRLPERELTTHVAKSLVQNMASALRLKLHGVDQEKLKQTWDTGMSNKARHPANK